MKKTETKCHRFWLTNRNPITMKKCSEENELHIHNQSREQEVALDRWRDNINQRNDKFNFNNQ